MTTKTQSITMFAIAAFALGGMMVAPAFAGTITSANTSLQVSGSISTDSRSSYGCVDTRGQTVFTQNLTVENDSDDSITLEWNGAGCSDVKTVKVSISQNGSKVYDYTHDTAYGTITIDANVNDGDRIQGYVTFYD